MKRVPSASNRYAPPALSIKSGPPPTPFHARTGEFTAPGIFICARLSRSSDFVLGLMRVLHSLTFRFESFKRGLAPLELDKDRKPVVNGICSRSLRGTLG